MKAGWIKVPIEQFAKTSAGGTPAKSQKAFYEGGNIPWLLSGEVGQRDITVARNYITEAGLKGSSAKVFPAGSVLVAMYGATAGEAGILRLEAATNQAVCAVLPNERFVPEYLYYYLLLAKNELVAQAVGNAQPNISQAKIKSLLIPLPPLDEQKRIVAVLDEAFEGLDHARANAEANLADARGIYFGVLETAFGSDRQVKRVSLGTLIDITHGFAFDGAMFDVSENDDLPIVLTPGNFSEDGYLIFPPKSTKRLATNAPPKYVFERGDLTVVMTDLSSKMKILGKPAFVDRDGILHNQRIGRVVPKGNNVHLGYIYHFLNSETARRAIKDTATGTMVRHTAPKRILALELPWPSTDNECAAVAHRLNELQESSIKVRQLYDLQLVEIEALRQSILQKAFSGELT